MNELILANYIIRKGGYPNKSYPINISGIITISGTTWELKEFKTYLIATIVSISGYCLCYGTLSC